MNEKQLKTIEAKSQALNQPVTPAHMLAMAVEQGADIDKMTKLMDLQERWEASQAKKQYTEAMSAFRAACPAIRKTRSGHNTKYAGLAETLEQIKPVMAEHGLSHSWKTSQDNGQIKVCCCVTHIGGHSECTELSAGADGSGSKNSVQAIGSTVSYLERYTLFAILGLASTDQDDDGLAAASGGLVTPEQAANITALIEEVGADRGRFLKYLKVEALEQLPANKYDAAIHALEAKRKK